MSGKPARWSSPQRRQGSGVPASLKAACEAVLLDLEAAMSRAILKPDEAVDLLLDASDKLADAATGLLDEIEADKKIKKEAKKRKASK